MTDDHVGSCHTQERLHSDSHVSIISLFCTNRSVQPGESSTGWGLPAGPLLTREPDCAADQGGPCHDILTGIQLTVLGPSGCSFGCCCPRSGNFNKTLHRPWLKWNHPSPKLPVRTTCHTCSMGGELFTWTVASVPAEQERDASFMFLF